MKLWRIVAPTIAAALVAAAAFGGVYDWSKTPASNTTLEGIGWSNSMAPTSLDDGVRAIAAALKKWQEDLGGQPTSSGTDTITLTTNSVIASLTDGLIVSFTAGGTNTGATTFAPDGLTAQDVKKYTSAGLSALSAGDIKAGNRVELTYETTNSDWILRNPTPLISTDINQTEAFCVAYSDETTAITAATGKIEFRMPYAFTLTGIRASLTTAQSSGNIYTVDVNEAGTTVISTKLTIDNTEKTSTTAVAAPVISDSSLADDALMTVDVDQIGNGTAKGGKVCLIGTRT